jgi:hypothetical protein
MLKTISLLSVLVFAACPVVVGGGPEEPAAKTLTVVRPETADTFKLVQLEGTLTEFVAEWTRQMPTPGWTFEIDAVDVVEDRIVVKLTEVRPEGMVVQMLAPGTAKIPLGSLPPGRYVLEIRSRRSPQTDHRPAYATVIVAR